MVSQDYAGRMVNLVSQDNRVHRVYEEKVACLDPMDSLDPQALPENLDQMDSAVSKALLVPLDREVRVVCRDHEERLVPQDRGVRVVYLEVWVAVVSQDSVVRVDHEDSPVNLEE